MSKIKIGVTTKLSKLTKPAGKKREIEIEAIETATDGNYRTSFKMKKFDGAHLAKAIKKSNSVLFDDKHNGNYECVSFVKRDPSREAAFIIHVTGDKDLGCCFIAGIAYDKTNDQFN